MAPTTLSAETTKGKLTEGPFPDSATSLWTLYSRTLQPGEPIPRIDLAKLETLTDQDYRLSIISQPSPVDPTIVFRMADVAEHTGKVDAHNQITITETTQWGITYAYGYDNNGRLNTLVIDNPGFSLSVSIYDYEPDGTFSERKYRKQ